MRLRRRSAPAPRPATSPTGPTGRPADPAAPRTADVTPAADLPVLGEGDLAAGRVPPGWTAARSVTPAVRATAAWSWRLLLIVAAVAVLIWLVSFFRVIVVAVAVALLLTVLLSPLSSFLQRRARFGRTLASITSVLGLVAMVAGLVALAGRSIANGIGDLWDQASEGIDELLVWLADSPLQVTSQQMDSLVAQARDQLSDNASSILSGALSVTTTIGHVGTGALIALFCTFFFLKDGRTVWTWVVGLLPRTVRERVHQAGRRGLVTLGSYTRTQILVALVDATGIGAGAAILGVPLALPLATLVFIGSFIPIVGAIVTGAVAVLVALVAQGPVVALIMLGVVLLVQQVEGHVLQPFLMGHAVSLHPVAVLLSVTAGSMAAGIVGALFAVPIAAVANTVVLYLHGHDKFPDLGTDDHVRLRPLGGSSGAEATTRD